MRRMCEQCVEGARGALWQKPTSSFQAQARISESTSTRARAENTAEPSENRSHRPTVNDLDAAPPEWRIGDVRSMAKTSAVTDGQHHARSRCWVSAVCRGPVPQQGRCYPRNARARSTLPGSADTSSPSERVWETAVSTTSCGFTATQSWRNKVQRRLPMKWGQRSLERLSRRTACRKQPSVRANQESGSRECETSHPGSFGSPHCSQAAHTWHDP